MRFFTRNQNPPESNPSEIRNWHTLYNVILRIAMNFLETRVMIKISIHPCCPRNFDWFSWGWSKKKKFEKKNWKWRLKKIEFFNSLNSQYFFVKILQIGSWVRRIDWCEGHWCNSTYMAVRLSDISSKTGKKGIFCVFMLFLSLLCTASRPFRLIHIN